MLEPNKAWKDALQLRSYELDQAISQSQVLYFASTMADFDDGDDVESHSVSEEDAEETDEASGGVSVLCIDHQGCALLQLRGNCCPPMPGEANLGCCDKVDTIPVQGADVAGKEPNSPGSALCSDNKACEALGLNGVCCPAPGGAHLSCCNE
jgi:hypothetical protein